MPIAAANPDERVDQLIILTERLTELIAAQAKAFEERRPHDAAAVIEETSRLANLYRHESARVRADTSLIAAAPLAARTRLVRATEALDAVLARQARSLEAARTVTEGLVRAIAEEVAVQRQQGAPTGYGPDAGPAVKSGEVAKAITLNKRA